jgi:hypothetical protein
MSIKGKILATVIVLGIIAISAYVMVSSQPNQRGGEGGLASSKRQNICHSFNRWCVRVHHRLRS